MGHPAGGRGHRGGPGGPGGGPRGGPGGRGGGGTITAINDTTLTLRTINGTETVDTSSATTYTREHQTISFSDLSVGEIVHVRSAPAPSSSSSSSTPPQPGTGMVDASQVTVVEPSLDGRVTSSSNGTYSLVGRDGQLLTVSTTSSTRYYNGTSQASSSAISDGTHIRAQGTQDSLTHLTADVISVAPNPPTPGQARPPTPPAPSSGSSATSPGQSPSTSQPPAVGS